MYFKELIVLLEVECGECGKRFYEKSKRPLDYCPHCKEEMTVLNSHSIGDKFIEVLINVETGEAKIINDKNRRG